jgi:hypothetical protein
MRGASFATKSRGPWKLIYYEAYTQREDAEGREKFLKSGAGRRFLRGRPTTLCRFRSANELLNPGQLFVASDVKKALKFYPSVSETPRSGSAHR